MPDFRINSIALFEPEFHHEVLEMLLNHFNLPAVKISILTWAENVRYMNESIRFQPNISWFTFENRKKEEAYIKNWIAEQSDVDLFVWITLSPVWYHLKLDKIPKNSILLIHNFYFWFEYKQHSAPINYHFKTWWHHFIYFRTYQNKQQWWLSQFQYCRNVSDFHGQLSEKGPFKCSDLTSNISLVIPGGITDNGRDYHLIRSFVMAISSDIRLELVFLGFASSPFARRFLKSMYKIKPAGVQIVSFEKYVPADLFQFYMEKSTLIWLPLKPFRYYSGVMEKVGYSTVTGGVFDVWKYQKPCFLPSWYPVPSFIRNLVLPYHHLDEIIFYVSERK